MFVENLYQLKILIMKRLIGVSAWSHSPSVSTMKRIVQNVMKERTLYEKANLYYTINILSI